MGGLGAENGEVGQAQRGWMWTGSLRWTQRDLEALPDPVPRGSCSSWARVWSELSGASQPGPICPWLDLQVSLVFFFWKPQVLGAKGPPHWDEYLIVRSTF